jgi:hypothetical protein
MVVPYPLIVIAAAALPLSYYSTVIMQVIEANGMLLLVPVAGISMYVGLISGYIPSPLYDKNEKWPREYAIMQLMFLILTASRLTPRSQHQGEQEMVGIDEATPPGDEDEDDYEYDNNLEELSMFSHWMGSTLHKMFYKEGGIDILVDDVVPYFLWIAMSVILAATVKRFDKLRKLDETSLLPMPIVFLRNLFLLFAANIWFIADSLHHPESDIFLYCKKAFNVTPGFFAPDYPFTQLTTEFADAWKDFHPSDLALVRLSHSILYPSILLLLTRRPFTNFVIWLLFIEMDLFHLLADMFHYVSGPELAEERLEFQSVSGGCYVDVIFIQTMMAYPLNFVYLTTSMGDTPPAISHVLPVE